MARGGSDQGDRAHQEDAWLVRALGMSEEVRIDRREVDTSAGDVWLICSDGLTALLSEETIAALLARGGAGAISEALLDAARAARCPPEEHKDNITVVVYVVE